METHADDEPWNPWETLRRSPEIMLKFESLHPSYGGGRYIPATRNRRAAIVLHCELNQVERNATLGHELIHHEYGHGTWSPSEARRECNRIWDDVARRLVPLRRLARMGWTRAEAGTSFDVWDVADEFRVPEKVARRALLQLDPSRIRLPALDAWERTG